MEFNLKKILRALLFSTSEPLSIKQIQSIFARYQEQSQKNISKQSSMEEILSQVPTILTATQIREAMEEISANLEQSGDVYRLSIAVEGFKLVIASDYADWIRILRGQERPSRLSKAALETLAIIAYRQPVTRAQMESIRGVSVDSAIAKLLEKELIYVSSRADLPGKPLQYKTTNTFMEFIGITNIDELPSSDVLTSKQINEWIQNASKPESYSNEQMAFDEIKEEVNINQNTYVNQDLTEEEIS